MTNSWTANSYRLFRILFGIYLSLHFAQLLPWAGEVFSNTGMLPDASRSALFGIVPSVFALSDSPVFVTALIGAAAMAAISFSCGVYDRVLAPFMLYILACLFGRNPLIANPALPYVGWLLLAHLFVPPLPKEPFSRPEWELPKPLFAAAWIVLALAYSYSGYTKLLSPSWVSGDAIRYVLQNPLARDYFLRELFLRLPDGALQLLTWGVMGVELLFAPLALIPRARPILWGAMLLAQLGFLFLLNFADLTTPMLLFHLLTFDPAWISAQRPAGRIVIYYDGECGLCHRVVRFVLAEDRLARFVFGPLQGASFKCAVPTEARETLPDSFVVIDESGRVRLRSDAVIYIAKGLGGFWRLLGLLLQIVPRPLRDGGYRFVGAIRYRLFERPTDRCPWVPQDLRLRFVP